MLYKNLNKMYRDLQEGGHGQSGVDEEDCTLTSLQPADLTLNLQALSLLTVLQRVNKKKHNEEHTHTHTKKSLHQ